MFDSVFIGLYSGSTDTSFFLDSAAGVLGCTMDESLLLEGFDTGWAVDIAVGSFFVEFNEELDFISLNSSTIFSTKNKLIF